VQSCNRAIGSVTDLTGSTEKETIAFIASVAFIICGYEI
jgi:hypothetical protein